MLYESQAEEPLSPPYAGIAVWGENLLKYCLIKRCTYSEQNTLPSLIETIQTIHFNILPQFVMLSTKYSEQNYIHSLIETILTIHFNILPQFMMLSTK